MQSETPKPDRPVLYEYPKPKKVCAANSPYGGICIKDPAHKANGSDHWDGQNTWSLLDAS